MHEFEHILLSWPHWAFEVVSNTAYSIPAYLLGRWGMRRHDRKVHNIQPEPARNDFEEV